MPRRRHGHLRGGEWTPLTESGEGGHGPLRRASAQRAVVVLIRWRYYVASRVIRRRRRIFQRTI